MKYKIFSCRLINKLFFKRNWPTFTVVASRSHRSKEIDDYTQEMQTEHGALKLKFIHITKTGGTSIEDLAINAGITWGRFHEEYGWWHEVFANKPKKLKSKYDWFMVVRNPYDRILSEFHCKWGGVGEKASFVDVNFFNKFLKDKIRKRNTLTKTKFGISFGNHYTEQYLYLDKAAKIHILKIENLKEEFEKLMGIYNIPLKLDVHNNSNKKVFGIHHMDSELIELIQKVYKKDFEKFGYDFLNSEQS